MTDWIAGSRGGGKTTACLRWMRLAPTGETRVIVCTTEREAKRLYESTLDHSGNETWATEDQFVSVHNRQSLLGLGGDARLAVDNIDLMWRELFNHPVDTVIYTWDA